MNALFDKHGDDQEFGNRLLSDHDRHAGEVVVDWTASQLCSTRAVSPPVHVDVEKRNFRAECPSTVKQWYPTDLGPNHCDIKLEIHVWDRRRDITGCPSAPAGRATYCTPGRPPEC